MACSACGVEGLRNHPYALGCDFAQAIRLMTDPPLRPRNFGFLSLLAQPTDTDAFVRLVGPGSLQAIHNVGSRVVQSHNFPTVRIEHRTARTPPLGRRPVMQNLAVSG